MVELNIDWNDVINKEARGIGVDFGEVQEFKEDVIVTLKGIVDKEKFYLPRILVDGYDGHILRSQRLIS